MVDVSIIITNYNYSSFLERCVRSCLNTKISSYEIVFVDDCSTDNSLEKLEKFKPNKNFNVIPLSTNVGVAAASNIGMREAKGRYIVRVDADDYVNEYFAFFLSEYLNYNHECFCVACDYFIVDEYSNKINRKSAKKEPISCGIMYRSDFLSNVGYYDENFRHREEEELRTRLKENYRIEYLELPLYRYYKHGNNKTNQDEYIEYKKILKNKFADKKIK